MPASGGGARQARYLARYLQGYSPCTTISRMQHKAALSSKALIALAGVALIATPVIAGVAAAAQQALRAERATELAATYRSTADDSQD